MVAVRARAFFTVLFVPGLKMARRALHRLKTTTTKDQIFVAFGLLFLSGNQQCLRAALRNPNAA
jgi:hypothetical protein